ncbi:hypothetical protein [Tateyamaria omphalii]|uniref:Uncharacterized protein n=1 Tax=Tateyamaria omphalii TaxID=299262 RepID=A0A1P8MVU3_9RHOB|nr:hypothetical protein [Tateyamaria omphalii]APX12227.1 hypothetical protein BWR18_11465 [Tateyamaria omphalii]
MMTPFDVWAPMFRAPFSGDVTQEIVPRILSPDIAGAPEIEAKIHTDVASYGTQLGKILEALQTLAKATKTDLPEIDKLVADIEEVKDQSKDTLRADAERALARLRSVDEDGWRALTRAE